MNYVKLQFYLLVNLQQSTNVVFKLEVHERKKKKAVKVVCGFTGTNTSQWLYKITKPKLNQ